jgi:hypothetical protein
MYFAIIANTTNMAIDRMNSVQLITCWAIEGETRDETLEARQPCGAFRGHTKSIRISAGEKASQYQR